MNLLISTVLLFSAFVQLVVICSLGELYVLAFLVPIVFAALATFIGSYEVRVFSITLIICIVLAIFFKGYYHHHKKAYYESLAVYSQRG